MLTMPAFTPADMRAMEFATQIKNVLLNSVNMVKPTKDVKSISASYDFSTESVSYTYTYTDGTTSDTDK